MYFYNARYYDSALGRFIQADTMVPSPANPQSLNRYAYTLNNPLRYTDPSGNFSEEQIMEYFGVGTWDEVLRLFEKGQMSGYWGWLEVLRRADFGTPIGLWYDALSILEFADIDGTFFEKDNQLVFTGINQKTGTRWEIAGETAGKLVGLAGAYVASNRYLGAGEKVYHLRYDTDKVDGVGAICDVAGIVSDIVPPLAFVGYIGDAVSIPKSAMALWNANTLEEKVKAAGDLALDLGGLVPELGAIPDMASLGMTLMEGFQYTP